MGRARERVCLQDGLRLDLNYLIRNFIVVPGERRGPIQIGWRAAYGDELPASAVITSDLTGRNSGWLRIQMGPSEQWIELNTSPRHLGGHQWYFECPRTGRRVSVLWKPPGAQGFASRHTWAQHIAYASQFRTPTDRALCAAQSLRCKLAGLEWINEADPPKPKWMRWKTYRRVMDRANRYEQIADERLCLALGRLIGLG